MIQATGSIDCHTTWHHILWQWCHEVDILLLLSCFCSLTRLFRTLLGKKGMSFWGSLRNPTNYHGFIEQFMDSLVAQVVKRLPAMQETRVQFLGQEDCLEKQMATHSSILAWKIPWTEEPYRLQSMGLQRVGHDWEALLWLSFLEQFIM